MNAALHKLQKRIMIEEPVHSDAIIWLQGNLYDRGQRALELFGEGYAPIILLSGNNIRIGPRGDTHSASLGDMRQWLVDRGVSADAVLIDDRSMHTRDQAVNVLALAVARNWSTLLLVGSTHHQLRAFLTFLQHAQDIGWRGRLMNQPAHIDWDSIPGGRTVTAREMFQLELEKIERYRNHVASAECGLSHIASRRLLPQMSNEHMDVCLERASFPDTAFLWYLRNQQDVYAFFRTPKPVRWEEHLEWIVPIFLGQRPIELFVIRGGGIPAGQIRFDYKGKDVVEISISVLSAFRGKGLASRALAAAIDEIRTRAEVRVVRAEIHQDNSPSIRLFEKLHFSYIDMEGAYRRYECALQSVLAT